MKILYLHQYFATRDSSTGTRSYEFARLLQEKGHDVEILTGDSQLGELTADQTARYGRYDIDGLTVHTIRNSYNNGFSKWRRILAFLQFMFFACLFRMKTRDYDIIFATSTPLTIGIPAMFLSWKSKKPYVFEVRDLWPEAPYQLGFIRNRFLYRALCRLELMIYKHAEQIVALSPGMKAGVVARGVLEEKVTVIPNSADLDLFKTVKTGELRSKYGLEDKFILAHIGSMGVINGLDYLINVARYLKKTGKRDIAILLVGDGGKRSELESLARAYKLDNVIFTGKIPKRDIPKVMADVDATIMSVKSNVILEMASPNKFFDSLAAGKPVLVNCNGWMRDLVENHQAGIFVHPNALEDIPKAIRTLCEKGIDKFGENARKLAEESFDRRKLVDQLDDVLQTAKQGGENR
ncbi:glycosyltransferase family 4 protein [Listeria weihenstephanensis]|uniref:Glycosyltransferase family 4 protein n=1 Tax=Listeria weihenstephanensis TaxID=1006155 RepID=A0A841ZBH4_9LIST|nr:glycosyltransferase family 4 protein [Listeria weihenstephanensis]MBC1501866.1 glycosyltransferase family 4 protein [Listeria weihenstephanensis]